MKHAIKCTEVHMSISWEMRWKIRSKLELGLWCFRRRFMWLVWWTRTHTITSRLTCEKTWHDHYRKSVGHVGTTVKNPKLASSQLCAFARSNSQQVAKIGCHVFGKSLGIHFLIESSVTSIPQAKLHGSNVAFRDFSSGEYFCPVTV